ncbi:hypothetical protein D5687_00140 [Guyparkeria sp. SCN-R1]|nr:hypothetical protein D5687_00140 [Guyparkeria sp. SCN-R1]
MTGVSLFLEAGFSRLADPLLVTPMSEASALSRLEGRRGVLVHAWNLVPKVREFEGLLRLRSADAGRFRKPAVAPESAG